MGNEIVRQTLLIIQIFFADHPTERRFHISQPDMETCYRGAENFQKRVREFEGRRVTALGVGCYIEYEAVGEDM
jgi:hypothetical protein